MPDLVTRTASGLYCELGRFHIDPWEPVDRAVITHAHADHAREGSAAYLCAARGAAILRRRIGDGAPIETLAYGERVRIGDVELSLHPAGHVLGSAQVRIAPLAGDDRGAWVVTGDYKRAADSTCDPFEPIACDVLVTEATFALPIYRWKPVAMVIDEILAWRRDAAARGHACVLFCYALGKAQRLLAALRERFDGPVYAHGAIVPVTDAYLDAGVTLAPIRAVAEMPRAHGWAGALILAPVSAMNTPWLRRFGEYDTALASGWMRVRGNRRRRALDRGFEISDHADWPALLQTVGETGARRVIATHGYSDVLARYLAERGLQTSTVRTAFEGEADE